jgi:hypothetical protein
MQSPSSPDPIEDPGGYQRHLLGLLGDDDPAEVQAVAAREFRSLLADAGPLATERPDPEEWSALECLAHLVDAEMVMTARYRWILAHDEPSLIGYDQDLWVTRLHGHDDPEDLLAVFEPLRAANIQLWLRSSQDQRARVGMHVERGPESFDLTFRMIAGHDRFHLAQAGRAIAALRDLSP